MPELTSQANSHGDTQVANMLAEDATITSPSFVFLQSVVSEVNGVDIDKITKAQQHM